MTNSDTWPPRRQQNATSTPRQATAGFEQRLLKRLRACNFGNDPFIVVGFSGGVDSLCLAAALARIARSEAIRPWLVHVDHRLRPESSDDAQKANVIADQIGLPIEIVELLPNLKERHEGVGVEEAARRERYAALAACARANNSDLIATAHHLDDQAETVLMHLFRGAGIEGAVGMRELSRLTVPWWSTGSVGINSVNVWRPLLSESKQGLGDYVSALGLEPIEDGSNERSEFRRNVVRNELVPAIEKHFPAAREAIARFADILAVDNDLVDSIAAAAYATCRTDGGGIELKPWLEQHDAVRRRIVRVWLRDRIGTTEISMERVLAVIELAQFKRPGVVIEIAAGQSVWIVVDQLVVGTAEQVRESIDRRILDHPT